MDIKFFLQSRMVNSSIKFIVFIINSVQSNQKVKNLFNQIKYFLFKNITNTQLNKHKNLFICVYSINFIFYIFFILILL